MNLHSRRAPNLGLGRRFGQCYVYDCHPGCRFRGVPTPAFMLRVKGLVVLYRTVFSAVGLYITDIVLGSSQRHLTSSFYQQTDLLRSLHYLYQRNNVWVRSLQVSRQSRLSATLQRGQSVTHEMTDDDD